MSDSSIKRMQDAMIDAVRSQTPNSCAHLYDQDTGELKRPLQAMFELQKKLQDRLAYEGKGLDIDNATFTEKVKEITTQWRNLTLEFSELLERLPYKEWKTYTLEQRHLSREELLEVKYEYIDMFHFFLNIGLLLDIDATEFEKLYLTKNQENFKRQDRGY